MTAAATDIWLGQYFRISYSQSLLKFHHIFAILNTRGNTNDNMLLIIVSDSKGVRSAWAPLTRKAENT